MISNGCLGFGLRGIFSGCNVGSVCTGYVVVGFCPRFRWLFSVVGREAFYFRGGGQGVIEYNFVAIFGGRTMGNQFFEK